MNRSLETYRQTTFPSYCILLFWGLQKTLLYLMYHLVLWEYLELEVIKERPSCQNAMCFDATLVLLHPTTRFPFSCIQLFQSWRKTS